MFEKIISGKHNARLQCMFIPSRSFSSFLAFFLYCSVYCNHYWNLSDTQFGLRKQIVKIVVLFIQSVLKLLIHQVQSLQVHKTNGKPQTCFDSLLQVFPVVMYKLSAKCSCDPSVRLFQDLSYWKWYWWFPGEPMSLHR